MSTPTSFFDRLKVIRDQFNEAGNLSPSSGVWITRISKGALTIHLLFAAFALILLGGLWWLQERDGGRDPELWGMIAIVVAAYAISGVATVLALLLDKGQDAPPSNLTFGAWVVGTALLGLALGHGAIYLAALVHPLSEKMPLFNLYFPEMMVGCLIVFHLYRLVVVRQWYGRLSTEQVKREAAEHGQALAQAQLKMLQAQIEPHFLFNTLASVQHLVRKDPPQADFLLGELIQFLRQAIPDIRGAGSTVGREMAMVQTYLNIVRVRMGGRLSVNVQFDPALADAGFPTLVAQTLVENAIQHGVEPKIGPIKIEVEARRMQEDQQEWIVLTVQDNGVGFGASPTVGTGVGLRNIRERLMAGFGGRARLELSDLPGGGVCASVKLPRT